MNYKVKRAFFDKETGEPYSAGDTYQTDSDARARTLQAGGYIAGIVVFKTDTGKENTGDGEKSAETEDKPASGGEVTEKAAESKAGGKKATAKTSK